MTPHPVKITVLDCVEPGTLFDPVPMNTETGKPHVPCPIHRKGQVFVAEGTGAPPEGFCPNAWHDIKEYVSVLHHGGSFYPWLAEDEMIRCCTDGLRPVIFRLERLANEE
jgi:uncharacterized repeat protein (TIGR04076 family)